MSFISRIFSQPTAKVTPPATPDAPKPPPTIDAAAEAQDQSDRLLRRKGSASTILVPGQATMSGTGGASTLLGG